MSNYSYKQKNAAAERKLKKILKSPERRILEDQFAKDHAADSDQQLKDYVKAQRRLSHRFKRADLIGYSYIVERFGSWENVMAQVNRDIENANRSSEGEVSDLPK